MRSIDDVLEQARRRLRRLAPADAAEAQRQGALLVDTRPTANRVKEGAIPGALAVERTVLEWRIDPASAWKIPQIHDYQQQVVIVCNEGFSSSLAAASLQDLGLVNATDLIGGFRAWAAAGLPVVFEGPDAEGP